MSAGAARLHRVRTDAALLRRFRAGDETAFSALHARYAEGIRSYAAYMLRGSANDPDDAAQDVFLRAYQALRRDERDIDVRPWLFRIAHNRCIDVLRRPVSDELDLDAPGASGRAAQPADPSAAIEQREAIRALLRDIGMLSDGQRSALLLRELGGLSHEAVAEALGISTTSSRMLVHRARVALTEAAEARDTTCREVRDRLVAASDTGNAPARRDRRHMAHCAECRAFRRAHAGVSRDLALLAPGGLGLGGLAKLFGGGSVAAAGGGSGAASAGVGGGTAVSTKLAVGACCALLAGGGAAVGVKEATEHPAPRAQAQKSRRTVPAPVRTVTLRATPTAVPTARRTTTTTRALAPARTTTISTATAPASPTAAPPAHVDPQRAVDLADVGVDDASPPQRAPSASQSAKTTIDLADIGG